MTLSFTKQSKILILLFFLFLTASISYAQSFKVSGVILEKDSLHFLSDVSVIAKGASIGTKSDTKGYFAIDGLSNADVVLVFSHVGYKPIEKRVKSGEPVKIVLERKDMFTTVIEVTGIKEKSPLKNPTVQPKALQTTIQTISEEQIQTTGATNTMEALKYTVSGSLTEQGRKRRNFFSVRGQSTSEFAIDGVSLYQFMDAPNALSPNMIEEVEIVRSSNVLLMGYSGLNGVVNLKTKSFDHFTTLANAEYGTFNKMHFNLTNGGKFGGLGYALSLTKDKTDGPDGRNAAEDMWNLYGKLTYTIDNTLEASVQHFYMDGMREFAQMQNTTDPSKYTVSASNRAMIWKFDPLRFNVTTAKVKYYESDKATTEVQFYKIDGDRYWNQRAYYVKTVSGKQVITDSIPQYKTTNEPDHVIGAGIFQTIQPIDNNYLRIAVMASKRTSPTQTNPNGTFSDSDICTFSGTLIDEHQFDQITVNAGIKFAEDYYKNYAPGSSSIYIKDKWQPLNIIFNGGVSYTPAEDFVTNLLVSFGTVKAPDLSLKRDIPAPGDTLIISLSDEKRFNIDLGFAKRFKDAGDITVTGFYTNRKNAAQYTGILYVDALGVQKEYLTNVDLHTYGLDLVWKSSVFADLVSGIINATFMRTYNLTNGTYVRYERIPETQINGGVNFQKYGFTFSVFGKYVSRYIGDSFVTKSTSSQKIYVGDYVNLDLSLAYAIPDMPISVYGRIINVTDQKFTTVSPVYPDYGRQFSIGVRGTF